jgi:TonB family protein
MNPSIHTAQVLPARAVLFLGIAGFHALLAYAFASGLINQTIRILRPENLEFIKLPPPEINQPPPPPVTQPTLYQADAVPLPDLPVLNMEPDLATTITVPRRMETAGAPVMPTPVPQPIRLVGRNVLPNTADYYPPGDVRFGYEGTTEIRSCVNTDGRLDGSPVVEASSGRRSLDKAAVRLAQDGKYAKAMWGETPVPNCYRFRVTFTLH